MRHICEVTDEKGDIRTCVNDTCAQFYTIFTLQGQNVQDNFFSLNNLYEDFFKNILQKSSVIITFLSSLLDLSSLGCRYGDRIDDCYNVHPSECYDMERNDICCQYCQHKERLDYPSKKA